MTEGQRDDGALRASTIQDLSERAQSVNDRALALEKATVEALVVQGRRWRRTIIAQTVVIVILLAALGGLYEISLDNSALLQDVDRLVTFIDNVCETSDQQLCDNPPTE